IKISNLKFEGCAVSYRVIQNYTDQKAALGDKPALGNTGSTQAKDITYQVYEDVSFNLKDINPAQVALAMLPTPKGMQELTLETLGKKDLITFDRKGSYVRFNADGMRSFTALPIKEKAGEAIGNAFIQVIKLCQAQK